MFCILFHDVKNFSCIWSDQISLNRMCAFWYKLAQLYRKTTTVSSLAIFWHVKTGTFDSQSSFYFYYSDKARQKKLDLQIKKIWKMWEMHFWKTRNAGYLSMHFQEFTLKINLWKIQYNTIQCVGYLCGENCFLFSFRVGV